MSLIPDFPENIAWYYCTYYFTTFEANLNVLIAAHNSWSSLE